MTVLLWIGLVFVGLLVVFLMLAFFFQKNLTQDQRTILRFLTSLCAGFAGGLITGEALFELSANTDWVSMSVSGAAGFALFFTVWFTYQLTLPEGLNFSLPNGWSFEAAVTTLASAHGAVASLEGFTDEQRQAVLRGQQIKARTMKSGLVAVGELASAGELPRYDVIEEDSGYFRIVAKE